MFAGRQQCTAAAARPNSKQQTVHGSALHRRISSSSHRARTTPPRVQWRLVCELVEHGADSVEFVVGAIAIEPTEGSTEVETGADFTLATKSDAKEATRIFTLATAPFSDVANHADASAMQLVS
jgi:hypothetical protein